MLMATVLLSGGMIIRSKPKNPCTNPAGKTLATTQMR
jgi:hypothetical protein